MHLYCVGCKSHQECSNPKKSVSANGRAMIKATCPHGHICCSFKGMAGEGFLTDTVLPFLKPLAKKAKDAALEAAKKKAEEVAKTAAEALVNKAADKLKEKMKGKGKPGELKQMTTGAKDLLKLHSQAEREAQARRHAAAEALLELNAPAPAQMSASQLASIKKKMRNM